MNFPRYWCQNDNIQTYRHATAFVHVFLQESWDASNASEKNRRVKICTRKIGNIKIHWTGFGRAGLGNQSDRVDG